ncbi:hypothetical protein [Phytohabitans kaempferiae]|uniref:Alkaline shock response membrane anchor protein AmaP n=1 Tax=Phytohabitans kaempferiae TaxID=1620943 RepID=A0ABV6MAS4_9ACTN
MTDAANRALWTVIGLVLLLAGVAGVLAHYDRLPGVTTPSAVLWPALVTGWRDISPWGHILVIVVGLLVALLGLWLARLQLRTTGERGLRDLTGGELKRAHASPSGDTVELQPEQPVPGETTVRAQALEKALRRDLARQPGIHAAKVDITGAAAHPHLAVRLDLPPDTDLARVRAIADDALSRFATTSGLEPEHPSFTARLTGSTSLR